MFSILKKKALGIDISDRSIEMVLIRKEGPFTEIISKARLTIDRGVVNEGRIKDEPKLRVAVEDVLGRMGDEAKDVKEAVFSLPDEACFVHFFEASVSFGDSEQDVIEEEVRNIIPVPFDKLVYAYKKIRVRQGGDKNKSGVTLIAVDKGYLDRWVVFFKRIGLENVRFDTEGLSQRRCVASQTGNAPFLLVDIGSRDTKIFGFDGSGLLYSHCFANAGDMITEKMAEAIGKKDGSPVDFIEAEKVKLCFGLELESEFAWLKSVIEEVLAGISSEINTAEDEIYKRTGIKAKTLILAGGGSRLKGLLAYFESALRRKGYDFKIAHLVMPAMKEDESIFYIQAFGAAVSGVDRKWKKSDPFFKTEDKLRSKNENGLKENLEKFRWFHPFALQKALSIFILSIMTLAIIAGIVILDTDSSILSFFNEKSTEMAEREQSLKISLPVNVSGNAVSAGQIKGRIARIIVSKPAEGMDSYDEIMAFAKKEAENKMSEGEVMWQDAVSYPMKKNNLVFPMEFGWIIWDEDSSKAGATTFADGKFKNIISVSFKDAVWDKIRKDTSTPDVYFLSGIAVFTVKYQKTL